MKIDRELQNKLLNDLYKAYPGGHAVSDFTPRGKEDLNHTFHVYSQLYYLYELGVVEFAVDPKKGHLVPAKNHYATITAKGIDLLAGDGGLSAILNAVTVRFDTNSMRELVETGLLMTVPKEKQSALKKAIQEAPGVMLQTAITKMVEKGMSHPIETAKFVATLFGVTW